MALPATPGSDPQKATLTKDVWTLVAQAVNVAKINNNFGANKTVWFTYVKTGNAAPTNLTGVKWPFSDAVLTFTDNVTARDLYLYPVGETADVTMEA